MTDDLLPDTDEIWKPIICFENYECTIDGRVRNAKNNRALTLGQKNRNKFYTLSGKQVSRTRCIELAFHETIHRAKCLTCGTSFDRGFGANYNYCSMECAPQCKADYAKARKDKWIDLNKDKYVEYGRHRHRKIQAEKLLSRPARNCAACDAVINKTSMRRKYCGDECYNASRIKPSAIKLCKECGETSRQTPTGRFSSYCEGCHNILKKERRRKYINIARKKGTLPPAKARSRAKFYGVIYENVNPHTVLKRDKYTCQICGSLTPRKYRGTTNLLAPEVDHIIPISKGGPHVLSNLQCLCRECNLKKSDKH